MTAKGLDAPLRAPAAAGSPFHEGELRIQERLGVKEKVARFGDRGIRPVMPEEHREFLEQLPFVFVATLDASGQPWASMVWGLPGFVESPDPVTLHVEGNLVPGDPLAKNLAAGAPIGILGLEVETRRRNRANGIVRARDGDAFTVHVTQSFGNCQKYIQIRETKFRRDPFEPFTVTPAPEGALVSEGARRMVRESDTFFIASRSTDPTGRARGDGVDVSHRGGLPGFAALAERDGHAVVTFPDYLGNFLFNTLGNIAVDPRVGLLFVDFEHGHLLSLTGEARVIWDGPVVHAVPGAQRLVEVRVDGGVRLEDGLPFAWSAPEYAPQFARL